MYEEYRAKTKLFIRTNSGYKRYAGKEGTNYYTEDGERESLPNEAQPTTIHVGTNNRLQPEYKYSMTTPPNEDEEIIEEKATETDPQHIRDAAKIIAVTDSSMDPTTDEAGFNWRITTETKMGLITKSAFVNGNPQYMQSY